MATDQQAVLAAFDELFEALLVRRDAGAGTELFADDPTAVITSAVRVSRPTSRGSTPTES